MDFDDLIRESAPPPNRVGKCTGDREHPLYEGAVMVVFAMHLLQTTSTKEVLIHPDGEHGKSFDFAGWLGKRGFERTSHSGRAEYGGSYTLPDGWRIIANPTSDRRRRRRD